MPNEVIEERLCLGRFLFVLIVIIIVLGPRCRHLHYGNAWNIVGLFLLVRTGIPWAETWPSISRC